MVNDTPSAGHGDEETEGPVLRPFEPRPVPPLPPVVPAGPAESPIPTSALPPPPAQAAQPDPPPSPVPPELPRVERRHPSSPPPITPPPAGSSARSDDTITMPRRGFLAGLGVLLAVLVVLAVLWQTADDGDPVSEPAPTTTSLDVEPEPTPTVDTSEFEAQIDSLDEELAASQATVTELESQVATLRERPLPGLPGTQLRRIVVSADAKVVSAQPESIAVLGAFGGLSLIDPSDNRVSANASVGPAATRAMRTATSVWVTNQTDDLIVRFDPATNAVAAVLPFLSPDGIDKDGDTIVVASGSGEVSRLDPNTGDVLQSVEVGGTPTAVFSHEDHGLWAAVAETGELVEIDRETFEIAQRVIVGAGPVAITAGPTNLWVTNQDEGTVAKVDPVAGEVLLTVRVGDSPTESVVAEGFVWVTTTGDGSLVQVEAGSGDLVTRTPLGGTSAGGGPSGISYGSGALWIAMQGEQSVVRVDLG